MVCDSQHHYDVKRSRGLRQASPCPLTPPLLVCSGVTERTVALLAFTDPASSPLSDLMGGAQRQKTASELNAAVLAAQVRARGGGDRGTGGG